LELNLKLYGSKGEELHVYSFFFFEFYTVSAMDSLQSLCPKTRMKAIIPNLTTTPRRFDWFAVSYSMQLFYYFNYKYDKFSNSFKVLPRTFYTEWSRLKKRQMKFHLHLLLCRLRCSIHNDLKWMPW
jgi:hypothetical protein